MPAEVMLDVTEVHPTPQHAPELRVLPHLALSAYTQRPLNAMQTPTHDGTKLLRKVDSLETRLNSIRAKSKTWTIGTLIVAVCFPLFIGLFLYKEIPDLTAQDEVVSRLKNIEDKINANDTSSKSQIAGLSNEIESSKVLEKENRDRLHVSITKLEERIDKYLNDIAIDAGKTGKVVRRAISYKPPKQLNKALPFAQEILIRARQHGTILPSKDINEIIKISLALLDKKYTNPEVSRKVLNTVSEVATYKTFTDEKRYPLSNLERFPCKDGYASLGGPGFESGAFVSCVINYQGGDIILKNVRFANTEFNVIDTPEARKFLTALLLSDASAISVDTSAPVKSSE